VTTKSRNYSAGDVACFLGDIGLGEAVGPYQSRVLPLFGELPSPLRVPVSCVVGVGVDDAREDGVPGG
jgi:lysophospholipase-3